MIMNRAPALAVEGWINAPEPLAFGSGALAGKVVMVCAFQMLCPGCVQVALPQAQRVHDTFGHDSVAVVGLHTLFEHHAAVTRATLEAFVHEYRLTFPIGIDRPDPDGGQIPVTMRAYAMQGTPTLLLVDPVGRLRKHKFGHESDLRLGAEIMALVAEARTGGPTAATPGEAASGVCRA